MIEVREARADELDAVRMLFREYVNWLGEDLSFQGFDEELERLPWPYEPPAGAILVAVHGGQYAGCVAVKPREEGTCEMKRLYVRDTYKGGSIGRTLAQAIIAKAQELGYTRMVLDTLERMTPARRLYASLGFTPAEPYYDNPLPGVQYLELKLSPPLATVEWQGEG